jgi:hypothetical protein
MTVEERLRNSEYEDVKYLTNFSYDTALIGVSDDNRAVYDFDKMVDWLMSTQNFEYEEAREWIEINTIRALPHFGEGAPIIMYPLND